MGLFSKATFQYVSNCMGDRLGANIVALEMAIGVNSECLVQPDHVTTGKPPLWVNRVGRGPGALLLSAKKCEDTNAGSLAFSYMSIL